VDCCDNVQAGQDTSDGRLANLTSDGVLIDPTSLHDLWENSELFDLDDIEQIGSCHSEVLAEIVIELVTLFLHPGTEDVGELHE
jgi:hypothetical protein